MGKAKKRVQKVKSTKSVNKDLKRMKNNDEVIRKLKSESL